MKAMILFILTVNLSIFMSCCSTLFPDEKLTMQKKDYKGNELRIDGYYYHHQKDGNYEFTLVVFLYRDGIIISTRAYPSLDLSIVETEMIKEYDEIKKRKVSWGVFGINDNRIEYEEWTSPTERMTLRRNTGYIENDTTFRIVEHFFSYNRKTYQVNQVWHFKPFDNKPDSTNVYIK